MAPPYVVMACGACSWAVSVLMTYDSEERSWDSAGSIPVHICPHGPSVFLFSEWSPADMFSVSVSISVVNPTDEPLRFETRSLLEADELPEPDA